MTDARVIAGTPETRAAQDPLSGREVRAAILAAAVLYAVGGALCATALLLPHVRAPAAIAGVGVNAYLVAGALVLAARSGRSGLGLAFWADLWGIAMIVVLCAVDRRREQPVRADLLLRDRPRRRVPAARGASCSSSLPA